MKHRSVFYSVCTVCGNIPLVEMAALTARTFHSITSMHYLYLHQTAIVLGIERWLFVVIVSGIVSGRISVFGELLFYICSTYLWILHCFEKCDEINN